jgi:hypothetical protein
LLRVNRIAQENAHEIAKNLRFWHFEADFARFVREGSVKKAKCDSGIFVPIAT